MPLILPPAVAQGRRERRFVDATGVAWSVREKATLGRRPALYFESAATFRRVTQYPHNWYELGPDELEILSHET